MERDHHCLLVNNRRISMPTSLWRWIDRIEYDYSILPSFVGSARQHATVVPSRGKWRASRCWLSVKSQQKRPISVQVPNRPTRRCATTSRARRRLRQNAPASWWSTRRSSKTLWRRRSLWRLAVRPPSSRALGSKSDAQSNTSTSTLLFLYLFFFPLFSCGFHKISQSKAEKKARWRKTENYRRSLDIELRLPKCSIYRRIFNCQIDCCLDFILRIFNQIEKRSNFQYILYEEFFFRSVHQPITCFSNLNNPVENSTQSDDLLSFEYPNKRTWCLNSLPSFLFPISFLPHSLFLSIPFETELKSLIWFQVTNWVAQRSRPSGEEPQIRFEQERHASYSRRHLQRQRRLFLHRYQLQFNRN